MTNPWRQSDGKFRVVVLLRFSANSFWLLFQNILLFTGNLKNMLSFISLAAIFFIALFSLAYVRIYLAISYLGGCPRVGRSGVLGYIIEAFRYTLHTESVILEGRAKFSLKPFVVPTLVRYNAPFWGVDKHLTMPRRVGHCFSWDQSTWTVCALVLTKLCVKFCIWFHKIWLSLPVQSTSCCQWRPSVAIYDGSPPDEQPVPSDCVQNGCESITNILHPRHPRWIYLGYRRDL